MSDVTKILLTERGNETASEKLLLETMTQRLQLPALPIKHAVVSIYQFVNGETKSAILIPFLLLAKKDRAC